MATGKFGEVAASHVEGLSSTSKSGNSMLMGRPEGAFASCCLDGLAVRPLNWLM